MTVKKLIHVSIQIVAASRDYGPVEEVVRMRSTAAIGRVPVVAKEYACVNELEEVKQTLLDNNSLQSVAVFF
jgi:hypothetical protein